ncbi:MAG: ABC transporter substrate-binding protein [Desulforhopalus sp.]
MKPLLSPDLKVADVLTHYPSTKTVFVAHGLDVLVSDDGMRALSPFLTVGTALRSRFIGQAGFMKLLEEAVSEDIMLEAPGLEDIGRQGDLTLLALMPCGLKMPFSRAIASFLEGLKYERNIDIRYAVEGNLNQELSYYSYVERIESVDELPDIIVSADFNTFYGRRFREKFVASGQMCGYGNYSPNSQFSAAGIVDPQGEYTVLGVNPLVMVANLDEVGERQLPLCWKDLLHPMWRESVTLRGGNGFFCHAVLLPIYQQYGREGLERLGDNVLRGLHPAQMIKHIDNGAPGAIYVMPEFFARRARKQERIRIIWPEDGALASPVTLQVKFSKVGELRPILDFLTGKELGRVLTGARFPVPHGDIDGEVQHKPLAWLGWDFLRRDDLLILNHEIDEIFIPRLKPGV